ncbi:MAG: hypothetical protein JWP35_4752 [Caulobacter sp.]|nr:hypothetical protein [Caulobacter sp.]
MAGDHKTVLHQEARTVEGGRTVQVLVAQAEIKSDINPSNVVVATGGGLLGALIDAKINSDRAKKAELLIQPVRVALTGFDVDALAVNATKTGLTDAGWFGAQTSAFGRDNSVLGKCSVLDASAAPQVAFFEYAYDLSPDFSSVRVSVTMSFAAKAIPAGKKSEARVAPKFVIYSQTLVSVVSLPNPSKDAAGNAARWSADNGKLARQALEMGFAETGVLMPRAFAMTEDDLKVMSGRDRKNTMAGGYMGRVQEESPSGTLLYTGGLVHVQTLS